MMGKSTTYKQVLEVAAIIIWFNLSITDMSIEFNFLFDISYRKTRISPHKGIWISWTSFGQLKMRTGKECQKRTFGVKRTHSCSKVQ